MKKIHFVLFVLFILSLTTVSVISPSQAINRLNISRACYSIPNDVAQILRNSCTSCHDLGGSKMASSIWSFSAWDHYGAAKQAKKSEAICKSVTKGSMPPESARKTDPGKIPTKAQIEIICKWSKSLSKK